MEMNGKRQRLFRVPLRRAFPDVADGRALGDAAWPWLRQI
jgi:hypothetical protein